MQYLWMLDLGGATGIQFLIGWLRFLRVSREPKIANLIPLGNSEMRALTGFGRLGYSLRRIPGREGYRIPRWLPSARIESAATAGARPHSERG